MDDTLKIGMAQIAPVWLNKYLTIAKIKDYITKAGNAQCELLVFGEALLPGYPFWLSLTHSADFNAPMQKEIHAHYLRNAIQIESGDLDEICDLARKYQMAIYLGTIERAKIAEATASTVPWYILMKKDRSNPYTGNCNLPTKNG